MGGGGGGGSTNIDELSPGDIRPFYKFQQNQFNKYWNNSPLLSAARTDALAYNKQLPGMLDQLQGYTGRFDNAANYLQGIVDTGGKASAQELRNVDQGTLTGMSDTHSFGALGRQLLNRDEYTRGRFNEALGQLGAVTGEQASLLGQQQAMQTGGLNQLTGVQGAATGTFTQLMNPILQVPLANLQARIAQAQLNEQASQASSSKTGGAISGGASVIGSVLPALMSFSDERLKEGIKDTGVKTPDGIPLKTFRYRGGKKKYLGAMAQDVEKVRPEAVTTDLMTGFKFIDLSKAGVPMTQVA